MLFTLTCSNLLCAWNNNILSFNQMVACDNTDCKHEWVSGVDFESNYERCNDSFSQFHLECVGLTAVPQEEVWYCEECEEALGIRSSRRKKGR